RENRTNLGIESVEGARGERLRLREVEFSTRFALLRLDEDEDRHMIRMGARPLPDLLKASSKGLTCASVINVLHVHHLEAGLAHHAIRIEIRIGRHLRSSNHRRSGRMSVETASAVSIDIKFNLTDTAIELLRK